MKRINCAIYVRKSTEKGLEQEFNSLHNQEEACRNYILSQAFNGWEYYKTFEDGGISGGTMKRPGLQEMMEEIKAGKIQVVCCYKVDRLSRSIIDFHKMMKEFEKHQCSFVSITQAFDTSTSMGKLTLNMLLSFAQFEREVASERIRDKKAASKRKGFWTGGPPPLGYDVKDKKLVVNKKEAEQVRFIFEEYLEVGTLAWLKESVQEAGIRAKKWKCSNGMEKGGKVLSISMLARLLRAKVYVGKIEYKMVGESYPGQHEAIISKKLFSDVQSQLDSNRNKDNEAYDTDGYLLSGKIFDHRGRQFKNQKTSKKGKKKYRYYALKKKYLPAGDIEEISLGTIQEVLNSSLDKILTPSQVMEFKSVDYESLSTRKQRDLIKAMVDKIMYHRNLLTFFIGIDDLAYVKPFRKKNYMNTRNDETTLKIFVSEDSRYLVVEKALRINNNHTSNLYVCKGKRFITITENNNNLIKALSIGWRYGKMSFQGMSLRTIGEKEHRDERTIYRYINLNYLSPRIVNDIMDSRVPPHIDLQALFNIASKYPDFKDQEKAFLKK